MIENINLTGQKVSAELHGYMYTCIYGYNGVFNYGSKLAYEIVSNNEIKIKDGLLCNSGRFMRILGYESLAIANGTSGVSRTDLIVAHFETSGATETHDLRVIKGENGGSTPTYTQGDLYNGDTINELPIYAVHLNGLSIASVEPLYNILYSFEYLKANVSNPNLLINGDFKVWQRGTSFSNIQNSYSADRWCIKNASTSTSLVKKSTDVPTNSIFNNSIHIKETGSENTYLRYYFENPLKGTYTLSFWYKTNVEFNTYIYDNGAFVHLGKSNGSNKWTKAIYTFDANSVTFINIIQAMNTGESYITGVKLEVGLIATPFSPRTYAEELAMCQRYYQTTTYFRWAGVMCYASVTKTNFRFFPKVSMRTKPTVIQDGTQQLSTYQANSVSITSIGINAYSNGDFIELEVSHASNSTVPKYFYFAGAFDAEIY